MARGGFERPPWWAGVVIVVASVVFAGELVYSATHPPTEPLSSAAAARMSAAEASAQASEEAHRTKVAAFLGDSYTEGDGASDPAHRWATLAARQLGWREENFGAGGTGYLNPGPKGVGPYAERVPKIVAAKPDIVVISGGGNDCGSSGDEEQAAAAVFTSLRRQLPAARIVVVTPTGLGGRPPCARVDEAVRKTAPPLPVIDASAWLRDPSEIGPDHVHPNDAGYAELAKDFVGAVRPLVGS